MKFDLKNIASFGVAGNFTGHLEQAGEAADFVNVKTKELQNTLTIGQYLEENSYVPSQIAVELNERILSKAEYSTTVLHENDILEIVSFMGGGR